MKEFLVGLLVILMMAVLSGLGFLLIPLLLVMGFFLRWILGFFLVLFAVWSIGKVTLLLMGVITKKQTTGTAERDRLN